MTGHRRKETRADHLASVLVPRILWSSSIFHGVADQIGYSLHLWQGADGRMVELSHHPDLSAPTDITLGTLGPNLCTPAATSKQRAIVVLWKTQAQLNAAGILYATTFLPLGGA